MEVSAYKGNRFLAKEVEDELMKFTMKSEDSGVQKGHSVKPAQEAQKNTDVEVEVEVNITECTKTTDNKPASQKHQDLTESEGSSSFEESDSDFGHVDDTVDSFEAFSDLWGEFDGFGGNYRRKKLTAHWRSFIQPILWRCKWTELQIKKLQALSKQYDRELEAHKKRKQIQLEDSTLTDGVKSLPFSHTNAASDYIRRKKRKMVEETTDVAAYMSRHNLFSYYENKKNPNEVFAMKMGTQKVNNDDDFWVNDDLSSFLAGDGDNSLEDILRKIEILQSQAGQLRRRVDEVISENAEKIFPANKFSLPTPPFNNSPANNEDGMDVGTYIASQLISEYNMSDGDELVLESAVTDHGDGAGSNPNANVGCARLADAYRNVEDGALIDNRRVKKEMNINEPDLPTAEQPSSKMRSIERMNYARSKMRRGRKRGGRRGGRRSAS